MEKSKEMVEKVPDDELEEVVGGYRLDMGPNDKPPDVI